MICKSGEPHDVAADLGSVWVTIPVRSPLPGYVCIVAKRHVREPFELPVDERRAFWEAVDRVAQVVQTELRPDKLNYEIHGNTIEHLHLHLYPRTRGDRFSGRPIDHREATARTEADRTQLATALQRLMS